MRIPETWQKFVASLERKHDRHLQPMDYIHALYDEINYIRADAEALAKNLPGNGPDQDSE